MKGLVRAWNQARRFGTLASGAREYFVHADELVEVLDLAPGQYVTFTPSLTARGLRATAVRPLESVTAPTEEGFTCPAP